MKFRTVLKFLVPIFGVSTLAVSLPLALTSCSNNDNSSPIQFSDNLAPTSYMTNADGVTLKVNATLNGQHSDNLYYKWFYKVNGTQPDSNKNDLEVNGYKLAIADKQNDTNTLTISASQLNGYNVSFKCAVYENGNDSLIAWSKPTNVKLATVVNSLQEQTLTNYFDKIPADQIESALAPKNLVDTIVKSGCGLTADEIKTATVDIDNTAKNLRSNDFANIANLDLALSITLNDQYQFTSGNRTLTVNGIKSSIQNVSINLSSLDSVVQNICKNGNCKSAQDLINTHFNDFSKINAFFNGGTTNSGNKICNYLASASATVGSTDSSPLQQIVFNLKTKSGYLIDGQKDISLTVNTGFTTNSSSLFLSTQNLQNLILGLNLVQSVNANVLEQSSVTYNACGIVNNSNSTNAQTHEPGFPTINPNNNNAVNSLPNNQNGKLFNAIMATLGFNDQQAKQVDSVTFTRTDGNQYNSIPKQGYCDPYEALTIPFEITVQLKKGATWANVNNGSSLTENGTVNFKASSGSTNYQATFTNNSENSKLVIYTNLVGVSLAVNMNQASSDTNKINFTKDSMVNFVKNVYSKFNMGDGEKKYVVTPTSNSAEFNEIVKLLGLQPGLFTKFIFECNPEGKVTFTAVLIKGAVMYGPTYMLYGGDNTNNAQIVGEKIFCNEDGSIPNWNLGDKFNDKQNHTMANPCKYAGFQITWKDEKVVKPVDITNIESLVTAITQKSQDTNPNINYFYHNNVTLNNPGTSVQSSTSTDVKKALKDDPTAYKNKMFTDIVNALGLTAQSNAIASINLNSNPNSATYENEGGGVDLPLNITITLKPGYTFGNISGKDTWGSTVNSFGVPGSTKTDIITNYTNATDNKHNSSLVIQTNDLGFLLAVSFGENKSGDVCFNQQKLNTFARTVYTHLNNKTGEVRLSKRTNNEQFEEFAKVLGLPSQIFSSFLIKEGANKQVQITCFLKRGISFSGPGTMKSSHSYVTAKQGMFKSDGSPAYFGPDGLQITWTNNK